MDWKLEVLTVPVADVDRALEFYAGKLGFAWTPTTGPGRSSGSSR